MSINPNAIVPTHRPEMPYERKRKPDLVTWLSIGALVLFLGVCGFGLILWTNGDKIGCALIQCDENPVGMPAPWAEIVAAADEAAQKASPDAVLDGVSAKPLAHWAKGWSVDKSLEVSFRYVDPNGQTLYVDMRDTDPAATVDAWGPAVDRRLRGGSETSEISRQTYERLKTDAARRRDALLQVRVSPRQAEALTWKEGLAEARNDNTEIAPRIYLELGYDSENAGKPLTWRVQYSPVPAERPPGLLDFSSIFAQSSAFIIDATTGEVLERDTGNSILSP
ncbi:MAG TPA: hypothetical protein VFR15_13310 [Chloroflexia bacterium]|nr:hypothetical protein [Chloroflexia bacterium]